MTKSDIISNLFKKSIFPLALALTLFLISRALFTKDGATDYIYAWILCGIPFGFGKLRTWFHYSGSNLGTSMGILALNFILSGLIGGFVLLWKVVVGLVNIPVTIYRLLNMEASEKKLSDV